MIRFGGFDGNVEDLINKITGIPHDKLLKGVEFKLLKSKSLIDKDLINKNVPFGYDEDFRFNYLTLSGRFNNKIYVEFVNSFSGKGHTTTLDVSQIVGYLRRYVKD